MGGKGSAQKGGSSTCSDRIDNQLAQFFSVVSQNKVVSKTDFVNYFPQCGQPLAKRLFAHISLSECEISEQKCAEFMSRVVSVSTVSAQNSLYISVFCQNCLQCQDMTNLLQSALVLFLLDSGLSPRCSDADNVVIGSLSSLLTTRDTASAAAQWVNDNCPELLTGMHRCLVGWLRGENKSCQVLDVDQVFAERLLCKAWWWILQSSLSTVFTKRTKNKTLQTFYNSAEEPVFDSTWDLLYSSRDHGLSANRLQHHLFGYRGPTLLLLQCDDDYMYAIAVDTEWREGTQSWGGSGCCVMRLMPDLLKLEEGENMIVFNDRSRNIPRGISIGQNAKNRVLTFKDGLEVVEHDQKSASVHSLEVWGCGDSDLRTAQAKLKKLELRDAQKAAKVKLPGQWDENPDRMILELGGVKVNHAHQFVRD